MVIARVLLGESSAANAGLCNTPEARARSWLVVFDDGRVESGKAPDVKRGHAPIASIEKLKADVAATAEAVAKPDGG